MNQSSGLAGVTYYEFMMQVRRRALWIGYLLLSALLLVGYYNGALPYLETLGAPRSDLVVNWASLANTFFTLGAGLLLADRFRRDRRTGVDELLSTSQASQLTRLFGKYTGSVLATLVPIAVFFAAGVATLALRWHDAAILPLALATFSALVVPPVLFVGAFSIACTHVLWPPLYQFLFVGYMFWAGLNNTAIPTLSGTLLSPFENYVITGFFGFSTFEPIDARLYPTSSVGLGVANIAVLLGCGALALLAAWRLQIREASHE